MAEVLSANRFTAPCDSDHNRFQGPKTRTKLSTVGRVEKCKNQWVYAGCGA